GAHETRDGIYETARTAAKALRDDEVMKWVTPQPGLPCFDPARFPDSTDTLYLLSESRSYAAPLIAAMTDLVLRAGVRRAQQLGAARRGAARPRRGGASTPANDRHAGRGCQHLPDRRPSRPVQLLGQPRDMPGHHPAVLRAGRDRMGSKRHGRLVGRGDGQAH